MLDLKHQVPRSPGLQQHNNINNSGYGSSASPIRTSANSKLLFQQGCFERKPKPKKTLLESILNPPPKATPLKDQNNSNTILEVSPVSNRAHRLSDNPRQFSVSPGHNHPISPHHDSDDVENYTGGPHSNFVSPCKYDLSPSKFSVNPRHFPKSPDIHDRSTHSPTKNYCQNDVKPDMVRVSGDSRHCSVSPSLDRLSHASPSKLYGRSDVTDKTVHFDPVSGKVLRLDSNGLFAKHFPCTDFGSVKDINNSTGRHHGTLNSNSDTDQQNINPLHQKSSTFGHGGSFNMKPVNGYLNNENVACLEQHEEAELMRSQRKAAEDENAFLETFSKLAARILEVWEGDDSLRKRIETLAERQQLRWDEIQKFQELEHALKQRIDATDEMVKEKVNLLEQLREDRMKTLSLGIKCMGKPSDCDTKPNNTTTSTNSNPNPNSNHNPYGLNLSSHTSKTSVINPSLFQQRVPLRTSSSSRVPLRAQSQAHHLSICQMAAFHILSSIHKRLTSFMCSHMCNKVNTLDTPGEKGEYLALFRGSNHSTPFNMKPLSEATYGELLSFVNSLPKNSNPLILKVYSSTLEAAEKSLCEEAAALGFNNSRFGNIQNQMGVYIQNEQQFKQSSINRFGFIDDNKVTLDVVSDVVQAAQDGNLGNLQTASYLVQYGCYFWSTKK